MVNKARQLIPSSMKPSISEWIPYLSYFVSYFIQAIVTIVLLCSVNKPLHRAGLQECMLKMCKLIQCRLHARS